MFIDLRERVQCERTTSIGCLLYAPRPGIEPTTQVCALTWNQTSNLLVQRTVFQPTEPLARAAITIFYNSFYFCKTDDTPSFISHSVICVFSLFLGHSTQRFVNFVDMFKVPTFGFIDFSIFLFFILFISMLILFSSFFFSGLYLLFLFQFLKLEEQVTDLRFFLEQAFIIINLLPSVAFIYPIHLSMLCFILCSFILKYLKISLV